MSLERLKKLCERAALWTKVLIIISIVMIVCQTLCLLWQALMPGKLDGFFDTVKLYLPFMSDKNNTPLSLFELAGSLFNSLFLFVILTVIRKALVKLSADLSLSGISAELKQISLLLIADSMAVPLMKMICYAVFLRQSAPHGTFDPLPVIAGALFYLISVVIQSKAVLKENKE